MKINNEKKFEDESEYINVNFNRLNHFLKTEKERTRYVNDKTEKFSKIAKEATDLDVLVWDLRVQKSLKQVFTSASFYIESLFAKENGCLTSYFFLSYYSLFHAFLGVLYLDPNLDINKLIEMPHSKVKNNFLSLYAKGNRKIISDEIEKEFDILRFYREYYSYSMPFNEFFSKEEGLMDTGKFLENRLIHCYQISSLSSTILENCFAKNAKGKGRLNKVNNEEFDKLFYSIFCKKHPIRTSDYVVEYTDHVIRSDIKNGGGGRPFSFSILLEHCSDQFNLYDSNATNYPFVSKINQFIFKAIS